MKAFGIWRSAPPFLFLVTGLLLAATCQAQAIEAPAFVMGIDDSGSPPDSYSDNLFRRIYTEAFRRLQVPLAFARYPTARLAVMLEQGSLDGESSRAQDYATAHPKLIRVPEPVYSVVFSLYTANPQLQLRQLSELREGSLRVEYRVGVLFCENTLVQWVDANRLTAISSAQLALRKLLLGRTDAYCEIDIVILNQQHTTEFQDATTLRKLLDIGEPVPLYTYLSPKNADLAQRLAATLKQMKLEGLIARYEQAVLRELGR